MKSRAARGAGIAEELRELGKLGENALTRASAHRELEDRGETERCWQSATPLHKKRNIERVSIAVVGNNFITWPMNGPV